MSARCCRASRARDRLRRRHVDDLDIDVLCLVDGAPGCGVDEPARRRRAARLRVARRRARRRRRRGSASDGPLVGLAPRPRRTAPTTATTRRPRNWTRRLAGDALATVFDVVGTADLEAFGVWTAGEVTTAIATSAGAAGRRSRDRRRVEGHGPRHGRAARAGAPRQASRSTTSTSPRSRARAVAAAPREDADRARAGRVPGRAGARRGRRAARLPRHDGVQRHAHAEGRGALSGRLGEQVAAPLIIAVRRSLVRRARCRARSTPTACRRRRSH